MTTYRQRGLDPWIPGPFVVMTIGQHCFGGCRVYIGPGETAYKCADGQVRCATCNEPEATGCAIHPVTANPHCQTCRDHGNPHPFDRT